MTPARDALAFLAAQDIDHVHRAGAVLGIVNMVFIKGTRESSLTQPSGITYAVPSSHILDVLKKAQELDNTEHSMIPFIEKFKSIKEAVAKFGRI